MFNWSFTICSMQDRLERDLLETREKGREKWSSQFTFFLGVIGSAVGLGNIWRFPSLVNMWVVIISHYRSIILCNTEHKTLINYRLLTRSPCRFGGGPFIVAYMIVLLLIGLPMMTLELTLGQKFQGGDVDAFGSINPRFRYTRLKIDSFLWCPIT